MSERTRYAIFITAPQLAALRQSVPEAVVVVDYSLDLANPAAGCDAYRTSHVSGTFYMHLGNELSSLKTGTNGRHSLPDAEALIARLQVLGIDDDTQVAAHDHQNGMHVTRLRWLLHWVGHTDVTVLNGGLQTWEVAYFPVDQVIPEEPQPNTIPGSITRKPPFVQLVTVDIVQKCLGRVDKPIVGAHAPGHHRGENETLDPADGHIPDTHNRFFRGNLQADGTLKPVEQLHAGFAGVLVDARPQDATLQCGSDVTACHSALATEITGLTGAAFYAGSWNEWCNDPSHPVATGPDPQSTSPAHSKKPDINRAFS